MFNLILFVFFLFGRHDYYVTKGEEKENAETVISLQEVMEHLNEQTNLVEILLSEFYCCAYTSFDMDYQHFIIENLQCIKLVST